MLELNTVNQVLARVYDGMPLAHALKECGVKAQQFYTAIRAFADKAVEYAQAKEAGAMMLAGRILDVVEDKDIDPSRARNIMQAFQWYSSKMDPKTFGEKLDISVTERVDLKGALIDARRRLRPVSDHQQALEVQDAEYVVLPITDRTGGISVPPAGNDVDPFS